MTLYRQKQKLINWLFTDPIFGRLFTVTVVLMIKQRILSQFPMIVGLLSLAAVHVTFWKLVYREMKFSQGRN